MSASQKHIEVPKPIGFSGQCLVAMPTMQDPNFEHAVVLMVEHSERGGVGLVLNQAGDTCFGDVFERTNLPCTDKALTSRKCLVGGPVSSEMGFVLYRPFEQWSEGTEILDGIGICNSLSLLRAVASGEGPLDVRLAFGYAGWGQGQLEEEVAASGWLFCPADEKIIFGVEPEKCWNAAFEQLGIEPGQISTDTGLS